LNPLTSEVNVDIQLVVKLVHIEGYSVV